MTLPAVFLCICVSTLPVPVQKGVPNIREQEKAVTAYLHLDPHDKESWAEGERILAGLDSVPFPKGSRLRGWTKFLDKWRRKEASKLPEKAGEYFDLADGTSGRYFIDGELKKPKGLFIGMHGGGVGSGDASSSHSSYTRAIEDRDWIGIFPEVIEKTECGWTDSGTEEWVLSLVERALDTFDIDPDKVYFGGHSMGGYGSWVLGAHHADRVAALMPSAGAPTPIYGASGNVISVQKGVVPNLRNVPMCVFQSTDDPKVGPEANQAAVKVVERSRVEWGGYENFEYWEVSDKGHGWPEGGPDALVAKIDQYTRDSHPIKVVWQPRIDWKR
ncbi:MAG: poly(3-hydroxybutyrate) depolymerase, partial [Planctomycetota bacterium]